VRERGCREVGCGREGARGSESERKRGSGSGGIGSGSESERDGSGRVAEWDCVARSEKERSEWKCKVRGSGMGDEIFHQILVGMRVE
jgi:hypothetical protein